MTHEATPNLISFDYSMDWEAESASLRRWVLGSFVFHLILVVLATAWRVSTTIEQPLASYEVSLVSLAGEDKPAPASGRSREARPSSKRSQSPAQSRKDSLPPLPTDRASERLSESFAGAVKSIAVPEKLSPQPDNVPTPEVNTAPNSAVDLDHIKVPSTSPTFQPVESLAPKAPVKIPDVPAPQSQPAGGTTTPPDNPFPNTPSKPLKADIQKRLNDIKPPPKVPALASVEPFARPETSEPPPAPEKALSQELEEKLPSVQVPVRPANTAKRTERVRKKASRPDLQRPLPTPKPQPSSKVTPRRSEKTKPRRKPERVTDSLKHVLESVTVPKLHDVKKGKPPKAVLKSSADPSAQTQTQKVLEDIRLPKMSIKVPEVPPAPSAPSSSPKAKRLREEIDQQLAKLTVPDVTPIASIRKRLRLQMAQSGGSAGGASTSAKSSRNAKGKNRYLGIVEAKIDQQWVAPPVSATENHLEAIVKFRILRSGEVTSLGVARSSGNRYYDEAATRAVHAAEPLPPFPPDIDETYIDVRYNFILGDSPS